MAVLILEQQNGPTLTNPEWSAVEAALKSVHPRDRSYFSLLRKGSGYVQAAGASLRMICEWRQEMAGGSYRHVVLGHPGGASTLTSINSAAGTIQLRQSEILTLTEVLGVFRRFFERGDVPDEFALRDVTEMFAGR